MFEPALRRAANRAAEEEAGPLVELHYLTCECEKCKAVRKQAQEEIAGL